MIDFLFAAGQFLCFAGLLYGLVLTIVHRDCTDSLRRAHDPVTGRASFKIQTVRYHSDSATQNVMREANAR